MSSDQTPQDKRAAEQLSRVVLNYDDLLEGYFDSFTNKFRSVLGIGGRNFTVSLDHVHEARSYHLDVTGPEGMYLYSLEPYLVKGDSKKGEEDEGSSFVQELVRQTSKVGDEFGHLYIRGYHSTPQGQSNKPEASLLEFNHARIEFREIPPGLLGPVTLVSIWLTCLTIVVGMNYDAVFTLGTGGQSSVSGSWPAVIFGLPAIVTGWLLSRATSSAVRIVAIPVFLFLIWLAVNCAALIILVAFNSSGVMVSSPLPIVVPSIANIQIENVWWLVMVVLTTSNSMACVVTLLIKSWVYFSTVNQRVTKNG